MYIKLNIFETIEIYYGISNKQKSVYRWNGNLSFLEEDEVILPIPNWKGLKSTQEFKETTTRNRY